MTIILFVSDLALSNAPMFLGKMLSGFSGMLLGEYCPCHQSACEPCCPVKLAAGQQPCAQGHMLWVIIGVMAMGSFLIMLVLSSWLRQDLKPSTAAPHASPTGGATSAPTANSDRTALLAGSEDYLDSEDADLGGDHEGIVLEDPVPRS